MRLTTQLEPVPLPVLLPRLVGAEFRGVARKVGRALGLGRPADLSLDTLAVPDSEIARRATALARQCEPDFVFHHSVRTYLFGLAVGTNLGLKPDRELLYLAAILHDVGLMPEHDGPHSFELHSAQAARDFLLREEIATERADLVHEAIALHTSAGIAGAREPEIALTHFGAGLDVIGVHREDVSDATFDAVVSTWPRSDFKAAFSKILEDQVARKPHCHIAQHLRIGFQKKIHAAPFAE